MRSIPEAWQSSSANNRSAALRLTCGALPPCAWQTLAPRIAWLRHGLPFVGFALQECR